MVNLIVLHGVGRLPPDAHVTIFKAAMRPQIGGAIVARENGLDARLVGLMVGIGIPLSLLTAAAWCILLRAM